MYLFIFNNPFPDNTGFGIRCKKAIDTIAEIEDVEILCRAKVSNNAENYYKNNIKIHTFKPLSPVINIPKNYIAGFYELFRNFDLMFQLGIKCFNLFWFYRNNDIKVYVVNSPLTVPFLVLILSRLFKVKLEVLEFHDLEPELALHIKNINKKNIVYKIEVFLEKLVVNSFNKIIVTTQTQAEILSYRTRKPISKIMVIPNTVSIKTIVSKYSLELPLKKTDFLIGYFGSFTFKYTIQGILNLIQNLNKLTQLDKEIKLVLAGNGVGLPLIKESINKNNLSENVIIVSDNNNIDPILNRVNVCIIPWEKDEMTVTMLPTKLFQYMSAGKAIIAPNYGEFSKILVNQKDAMLFDTRNDLITIIKKLYKEKKLINSLGKKVKQKYLKEYAPEIFKNKLVSFIS